MITARPAFAADERGVAMRSQSAAPSDTRLTAQGQQDAAARRDRAPQDKNIDVAGRSGTSMGYRSSALEAKRSALIRKAAALAGELLEDVKQAAAGKFIAKFYEHVPPADVVDRAPRNLYGAALSLWRFGERRRPGQAKVRVHNPDLVADGWSSPHTIVEIVNDDMPFLVDSVTGAINAASRVVHLIIHPILIVARNRDGQLRQPPDPNLPEIRESWMQIEITTESDRAELARLTRALSNVLADVRATVEDWPRMRSVLRDIVAGLSAQSPPVPAAELAEVVDFLRWLDDDNFTFL